VVVAKRNAGVFIADWLHGSSAGYARTIVFSTSAAYRWKLARSHPSPSRTFAIQTGELVAAIAARTSLIPSEAVMSSG
jgi:hypothetical protein